MNCSEVENLMHASIDGELDLRNSLEFEEHLRSCAGCRTLHAEYSMLTASLRKRSLSFKPPVHLERSLRRSLRVSSKNNLSALRHSWRPWALAASLALVLVVLWKVPGLHIGFSNQVDISHQVLDNHIRSLMVNHLTDVLSTNQHTVKPWFDGKIDFSPNVLDLTNKGFMLVGGRLEYFGGRQVAVLVYKRRLHVVNLFSYSSADRGSQNKDVQTEQGYHLISWGVGGTTYWAVSDLDVHELNEFADLFRK
jgi:anti-sigma factor RsiW